MGDVAPHPTAEVRSPERLEFDHDLSAFDSGEPDLDDWLRRRALRNEGPASRTYVVAAGRQVIGYYALANGGVQRDRATRRVARNMPDPVPVMILARLAVDRHWQAQGIGAGMLKDAVLRTIQANEIAGIGALLVHAISEPAKQFYKRYGFTASEVEPMTLMITLKEAKAELGL